MTLGSRIRQNSKRIIECFCEIVASERPDKLPWIVQKFPDSFTDQEILKSVPLFTYPCTFHSIGVTHFSFVLTNADSTWTFGFCRHAPTCETAFVILSTLPWHEVFYKALNVLAEQAQMKDLNDFYGFLHFLYNSEIPAPGCKLSFTYMEGKQEFICQIPDLTKLPSIPENRNLAEYFNAVDSHNMMLLFASMLYERRIIIKSSRLSRLSACIQAANSLLTPMIWQHIFIPVLPKHLLDYLSAPMPFLIGVPTQLLQHVRREEIGDVVILDADCNKITTPFSDLDSLPAEIVNGLRKRLCNSQNMLGDRVARSFLRALVQLIGGYRDALRFKQGERITFSPEAFITSRSSTMQPFLQKVLQLQIFQQFIEERLNILNNGEGYSDEFELENCLYSDSSGSNLKHYREWVESLPQDFIKSVKIRANPAMRNVVRSVKQTGRNVKATGQRLRSKFQEFHNVKSKEEKGKISSSAPSSPQNKRCHGNIPSSLIPKFSAVQSYKKPSHNSLTHNIFLESDNNQQNLVVDQSKYFNKDSSLEDYNSTSSSSRSTISSGLLRLSRSANDVVSLPSSLEKDVPYLSAFKNSDDLIQLDVIVPTVEFLDPLATSSINSNSLTDVQSINRKDLLASINDNLFLDSGHAIRNTDFSPSNTENVNNEELNNSIQKGWTKFE